MCGKRASTPDLRLVSVPTACARAERLAAIFDQRGFASVPSTYARTYVGTWDLDGCLLGSTRQGQYFAALSKFVQIVSPCLHH